MKIEPNNKQYLSLKDKPAGENKSKEEKSATQFEMLFAQQLVSQMTKGMFKMGDKDNVLGRSNSLYRYYVTDTLAKELAKNHKLGIADMLMKHWNNTVNNNAKKQKDS